MAKIGPLTPDQARGTLAHKIGSKLAPKVRQLATKFGVRSQRVFLVWTKWTGAERGEGVEREVHRAELLPTPRVDSMDSVSFSLMQAGTVPVGSVRVSRVTVTYTEDALRGRVYPDPNPGDANPPAPPAGDGDDDADDRALVLATVNPEHILQPFDFFYELIEDGRGDDPAHRSKFRLLNRPFRRAGKVDWSLLLERIGQDNNRDGSPATGQGTQG